MQLAQARFTYVYIASTGKWPTIQWYSHACIPRSSLGLPGWSLEPTCSCLPQSTPTLSSLAVRMSGTGPLFSKSNTKLWWSYIHCVSCCLPNVRVSCYWLYMYRYQYFRNELLLTRAPLIRMRIAKVNISIAAKRGRVRFVVQYSQTIDRELKLVDAVMAWRRTAAALILYLAVLGLSNGKNDMDAMYCICKACRHAHLSPNAWWRGRGEGEDLASNGQCTIACSSKLLQYAERKLLYVCCS